MVKMLKLSFFYIKLLKPKSLYWLDNVLLNETLIVNKYQKSS